MPVFGNRDMYIHRQPLCHHLNPLIGHFAALVATLWSLPEREMSVKSTFSAGEIPRLVVKSVESVALG